MTCRVLVVDGNPLSRERLRTRFSEQGYEVQSLASAELAEVYLAAAQADLLLLATRLPGKSGLTLARELRRNSEMGIILLADANNEHERLEGLECGADDYLINPVDFRELISRSKNLLRRVRHAGLQPSGAVSRPAPQQFADWALDTDRRRLIDHLGSETLLSHGEYQLLCTFLRNSGNILSRDQLMDQIRNREWLPNDRSIDVLVGRLRRKLHDNPAEPNLIITIHGAGYLFTAGVATV